MLFSSALLPVLLLLPSASSLGCMRMICQGNVENELRACTDADGTCGTYHGSRKGGRIVDGVDIKCQAHAVVYAPFDGDLYFWRPFGHRQGYQCADQGVRIEGVGQWQGYFALIGSVEPDFFGGNVKQGDPIGKSISQACADDMEGNFQPFIQMRLYRQGKLVDPTHHLHQCMCTGQICESNPTNKLVGQPFKSDKRYNGVKGWDIRCPMVDDSDGNSVDSSAERAPWIKSPIDGKAIGRIRLRTDSDLKYQGCDNDGVFIVGSNDWKNYEVRLYNVKFRSDMTLGEQTIEQGQEIAQRLTCDNAPDSVYMEVRYNGQIVDITEAIAANNCLLENPETLK